MPTTANSITYYVAADGTLRDGQQGSIAQTPRINYGTEYAVTLSFPTSTIAEGDQLQVAVNRSRTFFSSASATGDAPVAAVAKHEVTAEEEAAQEVAVVLSTNTRAMIDQVNGIDHPVRGFFGVHLLRGQSFISLAVADAFMMSVESGPDAISPSLPVVDYPTREEAEALAERSETAAEKAEEAQEKAQTAQRLAEDAQGAAETARDESVTAKNAAVTAKTAAETANTNAQQAKTDAIDAKKDAEDARDEAIATLANKRDILQTLVSSSSTSLEVEAGKSYNWTVSAASTISMAAADKVANKETRIDIYIDLQDGGSVTGSGVVIADSVLQSGWYKLIWDGTNATLYSTKAGGAASVITIPAATTSYTLQDNKHYQQIPDAVPTYTLPTASFDGLVHEITVLVDFINVTSCSFVDASNVPVTLQSAISPQIGEAYIFRCYWYGKWRVVPLKIRNAATATSTTGVLQVSDAVAGDALALRMTAPRAVVVNQLVNPSDYNNGRDLYNVILTLDKTTGLCSFEGTATNTSVFSLNPNTQDTWIIGHTYLVQGANELYLFVGSSSNRIIIPYKGGVFTSQINSKAEIFFSEQVKTYSVSFYPQIVDLTQYFNNDTTLIDSIQTWDDLVAYDPRFASYVEHNTGMVEGVQPKVKVSGKNLANPQFFADNGGVLQEDGSYYFNLATSLQGKNIYYNYTNYTGQIAVKYNVKYPSGATANGAYARFVYTDGTTENITGPTEYGSFITKSAVSNASKVVQRITFTYSTGSTATYFKDFQIELGSAATAYEPYFDGGTAISPSELFAVGSAADSYEAVSGVTLNKMNKVDMGTLNWRRSNNNGSWANYAFYVAMPSDWKKQDYSRSMITSKFLRNDLILNIAGTSDGYTTRASGYIYVKADAYTDATAFKTAMSGVYLYYELATPTTSQSTPAQISLQAGSNTAMQTDGGRTLAELAMTYENLPAAG